jgi:hypothetical protein
MARGLLSLGAALTLLAGSDARAQGVVGETCATSYEQAQQLKSEGSLLRSRVELRLCKSACARSLARDCETWLAEVERDLPSVALSATSADGRAPGPVRVLLDGTLLVEALLRAPVEVDPGRHTLTFEDAAGTQIEAVVTLAPGDKSLPITVRFPVPARAPPARPRWPLVLVGAGAVALSVGAVLGIKGHLDRSELRDRCAPGCPPDEIDAIAAVWTAGAVAASAGAALAGLGGVLYFQLDPLVPVAPAAGVALSPGGMRLVVSGSF